MQLGIAYHKRLCHIIYMTPRQSLKYLLLASALRNNHKDKATFRRSALSTLGCLENATLIAEVDRLDSTYMGLKRLISEVWNQYKKENE